MAGDSCISGLTAVEIGERLLEMLAGNIMGISEDQIRGFYV